MTTDERAELTQNIIIGGIQEIFLKLNNAKLDGDLGLCALKYTVDDMYHVLVPQDLKDHDTLVHQQIKECNETNQH